MGCRTEGPDQMPVRGQTRAGQDAQGGGARWGVHWGGQIGCPTGQDEVSDGSHVIGHVIFECHVTHLRHHVIGHIIFECHDIHLGWQRIILLFTIRNQC